jgi:hypothetical protein
MTKHYNWAAPHVFSKDKTKKIKIKPLGLFSAEGFR